MLSNVDVKFGCSETKLSTDQAAAVKENRSGRVDGNIGEEKKIVRSKREDQAFEASCDA